MSTPEIYTTLDPISYKIKENSFLDAVTPTGKAGVTVTAVSDAYKRGTYAVTPQESTVGTIVFDITDNTRIKFKYTCKQDFVGDDSFEFMITYSDGSKALRIVEFTVRECPTVENYSNRYMEFYLDETTSTDEDVINSKIIDIVTKYYKQSITPTKVTLSGSDIGLSVEKDLTVYSQINLEDIVTYALTGTTITGKVTLEDLTIGSGTDDTSKSIVLKTVKSLNMKFKRKKPFSGTEYAILKFKDFISTTDGSPVQGEEDIYLIFNARTIDEPINDLTITVAPYYKPDKPTFVEKTSNYPSVPDNIEYKYNSDFTEGDLLHNTKAHSETDQYGNKTIRLGKNVPEGAVNLAYYYNSISSFKDTVSIQETNTNIVGIKMAEMWVTKNGLPSKDDTQFEDTIVFNGQKNTPYEGYYGILYRDLVLWDEKIDIDQDPEPAAWYEQFRCNQKNEVPMFKYYDDGKKSGRLTLVHTVVEVNDIMKDLDHAMVNGRYRPRLYLINARYEGIISNNRILYNGTAKYTGIVNKKDGLSNIDPEQDKELRLFPDENGKLYDIKGNCLLDDDLFYITDKFKDDTPLYYKYRLNYRVYNSTGKDQYGNYTIDNVKLVSENNNPIPSRYKFKVFLEETEWADIYDAYVYTSFIPSPAMPIYVMYDGMAMDAYVGALSISPLNVKVGVMERLSVIPAMDTDEYVVDTIQGITEQSTITMNEFEVINDTRRKIKIQYVISAGGFKTPPIDADIINKKYAVYSEFPMFKDEDMIISLENNNGYMTARDILLHFAGEDNRKAVEEAKVVKVGFNLDDITNTINNHDKVLLFTDPDGNGLIYARTYMDTGISTGGSEPRYNLTTDPDSIYREYNGKIYKGFGVKCRNINQIVITPPDETNPLKDWYPKIKYSYFNKVYERIDNTMKIIYSVPEFHLQVFGKYGSPYKDIVKEVPKFIGNNTVKVTHAPMYVRVDSNNDVENIKGYKILSDGTTKILTVESFNFEWGYVTFQEQLSDNDNIFIDYTYEEQYYHYRGYYGNQDSTRKMIKFNINPSIYSSYDDTEEELIENKQTYNLFNKTVYFFLRPMRVIDRKTGTVKTDNKFCLYHKLNTQESDGPLDILIGRIFVRHYASQKSTTLIDTRIRGGGVIEAMSDAIRSELEPESDFYLDIGTLDGKPYQENSVLVFRFDRSILRVNGGRFTEDEVMQAVQRWSAYGMYPIIEYVDIVHEEDMPQSTLKVNSYIENQLDYNPFIKAEVLNIE